MRGTRWLLLVAIAAIVAGLGITYRAQKSAIRAQAPAKPASLPDNLNSTAQDWTYTESNANQTMVEVTAKDALEARDSSRVDLKGVTLKLHDKRGGTYDLVTSAAASYFKADHRFYSEGEVEITLKVPETGKPQHQLISIKSSGVNFDTNSGQAETDRAAEFTFEHGTGHSTGAFYAPDSHTLHLKQDVTMHWTPVGPHAKPMTIEAASLYYREVESEIWLKPWGRMTRENTVVEGQDATVKLQDDGQGHKSIRTIDATHAHGSDTYPKRRLQYEAEGLHMDFDENGAAQKIVGDDKAKLVDTGETSETTVTAHHVELNFTPGETESVLNTVNATGNGVVTERPLPAAGRQLTETHVLRSDTLDLKMRPDGREIESVATRAPGTLEFLPNQPTQHHRILNGKDMVIAYGAQNRVESFRAADVRTQTDPSAEDVQKKRNRAVSYTTSRQIATRFDPKTSKMSVIEQTGDFTYDEGDRKARAAKGSLDSEQNVLVLDTGARMSDATGSTTADRIRMDQRTGDFTAEGHVNSSRMPDKDQKKNSEMLSGDEPMHAQARKMDSSNHNRKLHYEGNVVMWQGANTIKADVIDLDREKKGLIADGHVITNLWEEPKDEQKKKTTTPVMTEVHAPHLEYTEADRLAVYSGGASLARPNLHVKSHQIQAYLADSGADSRLEKAFADGAVEIHQTSGQGVTYNGTAEHSEYYTGEQKVILQGGVPKMVDSKGNTTIGPGGLTYYVNDDRLLVNGSDGKPANSRLVRKKK
jgi:lipopolysaccharide export system protein LptA